jgi:hypothetical protein
MLDDLWKKEFLSSDINAPKCRKRKWGGVRVLVLVLARTKLACLLACGRTGLIWKDHLDANTIFIFRLRAA